MRANVAIREHGRDALERLCSYMCRPPLAIDRLQRLQDGRQTYRMKTPWRDIFGRLFHLDIAVLEEFHEHSRPLAKL